MINSLAPRTTTVHIVIAAESTPNTLKTQYQVPLVSYH